MPKKILTIDLDGTLIDHHNKIIGGKETISYLHKLIDIGFKLVVNTGRLDHDIVYIKDKYQLPISVRISQNGAVYQTDTSLDATLIDTTTALSLYTLIKDKPLRLEINTVSNRYWLSNRHPLFPKEFYDSSKIVSDYNSVIEYQPITLFLVIGKLKDLQPLQQTIRLSYPNINPVLTSDASLELLPQNVSKGSTIKHMFPKTDIYAIGDSENDYSVFDIAYKAYLVGDKVHTKATQCTTILEALKDIYKESI